MPQDGKTPAKVPRHFRWVLGEYLNLPFKEFSHATVSAEARRLQPDAMLEDPCGRRRYFIEFETGSATVFDAKKTASTLAKLQRYSHYFNDPAGTLFNEKDTWYSRSFKEPWPAEVLFVTQTEARRDSIAKLISGFAPGRLVAHALSVVEAKRRLCLALHVRNVPPGTEPTPSIPATRVAQRVARSANEERLRRGRVSVRGEQLINFEKTLRESLATLTKAREVLLSLRVRPELIPPVPSNASGVLRVLGEYARRGTDALSINGLTEAE